MNYVAPMAEAMFNYTYGPPAGMPRTNARIEERAVEVHSLRPVERDISLDVEGFAIVPRESKIGDFYDEAELRRVYYPEMEALVADATGAKRVIVFDHTVRRRLWETQDRVPGVARQPVMRVHNDYTETSGPQRVRDLAGADAEALLRRRFAFINVWRPIRGPLLDHPLGLCDARSMAAQDFVPTEQRYEDRSGEIYNVRWSPAHRWFYVPAMQPDETVLIKCYDSEPGIARFVAHSAFADPTTPEDAPPRESIEIRTIAFFA
jgi:hypothetical protein